MQNALDKIGNALPDNNIKSTLRAKYKMTDEGHCQVYYTNDVKYLYCLQKQNNKGDYTLLRCSKDGEPSYEVDIKRITEWELPTGNSNIDAEVIAFLARNPVEYI